MKQSSGRFWDFVGVSREVGGLRDGTLTNKLTNKEKPFHARGKAPFEHSTNKKNTFQARSCLSSKGYLPIKCRSLQVVGVSRQGKAVVSDGWYGVIGG